MSFNMAGEIIEEYTVRNNRLGLVRFADTCRPVFLDLVPNAHIGDYVRVHVGFAIEQVSAAEAAREYELLGCDGHTHPAEELLQADDAAPEARRRQKRTRGSS